MVQMGGRTANTAVIGAKRKGSVFGYRPSGRTRCECSLKSAGAFQSHSKTPKVKEEKRRGDLPCSGQKRGHNERTHSIGDAARFAAKS